MNSGPLLFFGILFTLASSFWGLLLVPQLKLGGQEVVKIETTGQLYPLPRPAAAQAGADEYRSLGCVECHTQQVRARGFGTDFARGWGLRFTVAQDYLRDYPVQLGYQRVGPDLANIGGRQTNAVWLLAHLYDPQRTAPGSMMPPYQFLFEERKLRPGQRPSPEALPAEYAPAGYEIVPREQARDLVAYLLSLHAAPPLFESPLPAAPKQTGAASTNNAAAGPSNAAPPNATDTNATGTNPPASSATNSPPAP